MISAIGILFVFGSLGATEDVKKTPTNISERQVYNSLVAETYLTQAPLVNPLSPRYGDLYLAEYPYRDWRTEEQCGILKGKPCASFLCGGNGEHYTDEFCCCDTEYSKMPPSAEKTLPIYAIAEGSKILESLQSPANPSPAK